MKSVCDTLPKVIVSFDRKRHIRERVYVKSSDMVYDVCLSIWNINTIDLYEEFKVIYLDRRNGIMGYRDLSRGSCTGTVVDVKMVISIALSCNASSLVLCHNHPSGKTDPSQQDISLTKKIADASKLFDLKLQDHLVIGREGYYSFMDEGLLGIEALGIFGCFFDN